MLSQNEIWAGIVHKWAVGPQIIDFIETCLDSDYYDNLSTPEQSSLDVFYHVILDELADQAPNNVLYEYVEYRLADYGWELED